MKINTLNRLNETNQLRNVTKIKHNIDFMSLQSTFTGLFLSRKKFVNRIDRLWFLVLYNICMYLYIQTEKGNSKKRRTRTTIKTQNIGGVYLERANETEKLERLLTLIALLILLKLINGGSCCRCLFPIRGGELWYKGWFAT